MGRRLKWVPSWAVAYQIIEIDPHHVQIQFFEELGLPGSFPIDHLMKDLAIKDVCKMIGEKRNKYHREIKPGVHVDVYDVLAAFTADLHGRIKAAVDHGLKKMLCAGERGHKDLRQDLVEARQSLDRAIQQLDEWA